jgi:hypothetical protein
MALYAATLALLEWFALALQFYLALSLSVENGTGLLQGGVNYFSYFTILSNLIVALVLTCWRWSPNSRWGSFFARPTTQSAAAVYITIVCAVYSLVLRNIWNPQGLQKLADVLLHDLLPVLYVIFWFAFVQKNKLRWVDALWWLVFPTLYCGYVLARGSRTGWYPYPFLHATNLGYAGVARNGFMLLFAFLALGLGLIAIAKWLSRRAVHSLSH